jgi:PAB1-binding protein PBP1
MRRKNFRGEGKNTDRQMFRYGLISQVCGISRFACFHTEGDDGGGGGSGSGGSGSGGGGGSTKKNWSEGLTAEQAAAIQAHFNQVAGDARKEGRESARREAEAEAARVAAEAEAARKAEAGEYKALYESSKTEVESLKGLAESLKILEADFHASIDEEIKDWPESLKKTDPGKSNLSSRREWVKNSRDLAAELSARRTGSHNFGEGSGYKSGSDTKPGSFGLSYRKPGG